MNTLNSFARELFAKRLYLGIPSLKKSHYILPTTKTEASVHFEFDGQYEPACHHSVRLSMKWQNIIVNNRYN